MDAVINHANKGGLLLGICNGFQILCESGLLPGALLHNNNQKFICKNVYLTPSSKTAGLTKDLTQGKAYKIPIAHGEGRYFADDDTIQSLFDKDQVLFQYCNQDGIINDGVNPNGSVQNIAGVTNTAKNVMGMMPHPERAVDELLGNQDGVALFESLINLSLA